MGSLFCYNPPGAPRKAIHRNISGIRNASRHLSPFPDYLQLLSFFNDRGTDYPAKDIILAELIAAYTRDQRYNALASLFILIFAPLIVNRCKRFLNINRQNDSSDAGNEIFQELCFELLDIIKRQESTKEKLFGVISGKLKNSFQKVLKIRVEEMKQNLSAIEEIPDTVRNGQDQKMHIAGIIDKISHLEIVDAGKFLDEMVRVRVITASTRDFLAENIIDEKSLAEISHDKKMDVTLRKRKSRALQSIRKYLIEQDNKNK